MHNVDKRKSLHSDALMHQWTYVNTNNKTKPYYHRKQMKIYPSRTKQFLKKPPAIIKIKENMG
jgi:hypothetical protein